MPSTNIAPLGFGTWGLSDTECVESTVSAIEAGYRHIDTAQMYGNEVEVGEAIARADVPREELFVATKVWYDRLGYDDVIRTAAESCEKLGLETIDLLYVHWPADDYDAEETLSAFDHLVQDGTIRHVGLSNFTLDLLDEARTVLDAPVFAHQVEMHPLLHQADLVADAQAHDHYLVAYCPLGRGEVFEMPELQPIADKHDATVAQVSLAWLMSKDRVVPIPKSSNPEHIREDYEAIEVTLDEDDIAAIDAIDRELRVVDPPHGPWNRS